MTKETLIGTWNCTKSIRNGKEKLHKNPKITISFAENGTGKLKLAILPFSFKWTFEDNELKMYNVSDGNEVANNLKIEDDCIVMRAEGSESYFYKA